MRIRTLRIDRLSRPGRPLVLFLLLGALPLAAQQPEDRAPPASEPPASPQAENEELHACFVPASGTVYRIGVGTLGEQCLAPDHVRFSWNRQGSPGPAGPQGEPGADGPPGPPGEPGTTDHGQLSNLGSDDHPQYVLAEGVRAAVDGFAITGTFNEGSIPVEGAGVRLMWLPRWAAFRAGMVEGTQWDGTNVGRFSVAMGKSPTASGPVSVAMGDLTRSTGAASTAMGVTTTARGGASTAMGQSTNANGRASTAMGRSNTASGDYSTAMGLATTASGEASTSGGDNSRASGDYSTAMGFRTTAQPYASLVIGRFNLIAGSATSWLNNDPLFVAGNGANASSRSNALILRKNGNLTIAGRFQFGSMPAQTSTNLCVATVPGIGFEPASCSSSIRYKDAIRELDPPAAAALVERLRPVAFRWTASGLDDLGLIAEEVAALDPRLATYDADGQIEGVKYNHLSALLAAALQDQQAQIRSLRSEVDRVRAENGTLRAAVELLRAELANAGRRLERLEAGREMTSESRAPR